MLIYVLIYLSVVAVVGAMVWITNGGVSRELEPDEILKTIIIAIFWLPFYAALAAVYVWMTFIIFLRERAPID